MRTIPTLTGPTDSAAPPGVVAPPSPLRGSEAAWRSRSILDDPVTASVLYTAWSGDSGIVMSPPGGGKSTLVALLAASLAERAGLRVGVATQTREQAAEVARRTGRLYDGVRLAWSARGHEPDLTGTSAVVARKGRVGFPATAGGVLVATTSRWLYLDHNEVGCDVMIVDEAFQGTYADTCALGAFASELCAIGDPGQTAPVVTGSTHRWDGSPTAPHLPGPAALLAAYGDVLSVVRLRHTFRLGPVTTALLGPTFYPSLPFTSRRPPEHLSVASGEPLPEVTVHPVAASGGPSDPAFVQACADRARRLLAGSLTTASGTRPLAADDVMVVTAHVAQAAAVQALLADHPAILVGTANAVQGMERPAVVALHPLAGYRTLDGFGTEPGRACVMLSRHRAHLSLITDPATERLLDVPDPDEGTRVHRRLWAALAH